MEREIKPFPEGRDKPGVLTGQNRETVFSGGCPESSASFVASLNRHLKLPTSFKK